MPPPPPTSSLESGQSPRGLLRPGRRLRSGTHQCFHRDHPRFGFASHPAKRRDDVKQVLRRHAIPSGRLHADCGQQRNLEIGRAHVWTPVTNAHLVCRLLLEKKKTDNNSTYLNLSTTISQRHTESHLYTK